MSADAVLELSDDELRLLWLACEVFPNAESPLTFLGVEAKEPNDAEVVFARLAERGLMTSGGAATASLAARLGVVAECGARVSVAASGGSRRDFFVAGGSAVEYGRAGALHRFGPLGGEAELVRTLAGTFTAAETPLSKPLVLSAGDYLVFAVLARDQRAAGAEEPDADAMSIEEVLAYFDEPETKYVRTPSDDSWQASLHSLTKAGVLLASRSGYALHPVYHSLARGIAADQQVTISRLDFFSDEWLVRELNLYPASGALYRFGTQVDGSVAIQEVAASQLATALAAVVGTLPNLLSQRLDEPVKRGPVAARVSAKKQR
jgi:hypothetical protein